MYLSNYLELDDLDEIEDQSITSAKSKKSLSGSGSSVKRTMVGNHEPMSKKNILTDSSNSIRNESRLKPLDDSRDGMIFALFIVYISQTTFSDLNEENEMDVQETNDTERTTFVSYKEHAKLKRDLNQKNKQLLAVEKKLDFMKKNYMRE